MAKKLVLALTLTLLSPFAAQGAEISTIGPGGIRGAATQLIAMFEKASGHKVVGTFGSGGGTKQQVIKGEAFDVPIVQPPVDPVVKSGNVDAKTEKLLANVWVGVAVRTGEPKPDISSGEAVKKLLLASRAISYPNGATGAGAGISFDATLKKLGIYEQMQPKIKIAQGGAGAMAMLAKGEVDLGLTYISEILPEPGVEVVGPLPKDISEPTGLVGYVSAHAKDKAVAQAFLDFLSSPQAATVYRERGMVPGSE